MSDNDLDYGELPFAKWVGAERYVAAMHELERGLPTPKETLQQYLDILPGFAQPYFAQMFDASSMSAWYEERVKGHLSIHVSQRDVQQLTESPEGRRINVPAIADVAWPADCFEVVVDDAKWHPIAMPSGPSTEEYAFTRCLVTVLRGSETKHGRAFTTAVVMHDMTIHRSIDPPIPNTKVVMTGLALIDKEGTCAVLDYPEFTAKQPGFVASAHAMANRAQRKTEADRAYWYQVLNLPFRISQILASGDARLVSASDPYAPASRTERRAQGYTSRENMAIEILSGRPIWNVLYEITQKHE